MRTIQEERTFEGEEMISLKKSIVAAVAVLMSFYAVVFPAPCAGEDRPMLIRILREKPQDLEDGRFLLEVSPGYYKYKTDTRDWLSAGLLLKADIGKSWEVSIGGDILSYQRPDFGLGDLFVGAKWNFYKKNDWIMALAGYVLFPIGDKAFREPGIEPSLAFLVSRKLGNWEIVLTLGSTYAADVQGDPNYPDVELSLEVDYTPDGKNSFSVYASGYGPDQRTDGLPRTSVGASYTRTLTDRQSVSILLMKGLAGRGMDWSGTLTYSFSF